jgi:hypothetical protein
VGRDDQGGDAHEELTVDATFEEDLLEIEASVVAYLERPDDDARAALVASLGRLDEQIERSEAFDTNRSGAFTFGSAPSLAIVGDATDNPIVEQVVAAEFQAQVTLVRAAKDEVRDPSPRALEALRSASAALTEARSRSRD